MRQERDSREMVLIDQDLSQDQDLSPGTQGMIDPEGSLSMTDQGEMEKVTEIVINHDRVQDLCRLLSLDVLNVTAELVTR